MIWLCWGSQVHPVTTMNYVVFRVRAREHTNFQGCCGVSIYMQQAILSFVLSFFVSVCLSSYFSISLLLDPLLLDLINFNELDSFVISSSVSISMLGPLNLFTLGYNLMFMWFSCCYNLYHCFHVVFLRCCQSLRLYFAAWFWCKVWPRSFTQPFDSYQGGMSLDCYQFHWFVSKWF